MTLSLGRGPEARNKQETVSLTKLSSSGFEEKRGFSARTCLAKTAMSSLKESEEQTSPPATPGSRGVQVANSHFSKTSANRGNNGCLTGSATQRHTHGDGVQRGRSKNCNQQVWRVCIPSLIQQAHNTLHPQSAEPGPQTERKQPGLIPGFTGLFRSALRSP